MKHTSCIKIILLITINLLIDDLIKTFPMKLKVGNSANKYGSAYVTTIRKSM